MGTDDDLLPEQRARKRIDEMLVAAGWVVQDYRAMNVRAAQGVAVRELPTAAGPADYVLFVDRQAIGVIEAKKVGTPLTGVEPQTRKYQESPKDELARRHRRRAPPDRLRVDRRRDLVHLGLRPRAHRPPGLHLPPARDAGPLARGPRQHRLRAPPSRASSSSPTWTPRGCGPPR